MKPGRLCGGKSGVYARCDEWITGDSDSLSCSLQVCGAWRACPGMLTMGQLRSTSRGLWLSPGCIARRASLQCRRPAEPPVAAVTTAQLWNFTILASSFPLSSSPWQSGCKARSRKVSPCRMQVGSPGVMHTAMTSSTHLDDPGDHNRTTQLRAPARAPTAHSNTTNAKPTTTCPHRYIYRQAPTKGQEGIRGQGCPGSTHSYTISFSRK